MSVSPPPPPIRAVWGVRVVCPRARGLGCARVMCPCARGVPLRVVRGGSARACGCGVVRSLRGVWGGSVRVGGASWCGTCVWVRGVCGWFGACGVCVPGCVVCARECLSGWECHSCPGGWCVVGSPACLGSGLGAAAQLAPWPPRVLVLGGGQAGQAVRAGHAVAASVACLAWPPLATPGQGAPDMPGSGPGAYDGTKKPRPRGPGLLRWVRY